MSVVAQKFDERRVGVRILLQDSLFLTGVVWLSLILYVDGLGFYSDDWDFLSTMQRAADGTLSSVFSALHEKLSTRPLQALQLAALYWAFGLEPVGYHVVNGIVFSGMIVLFYLALREIGLPRMPAVTIPLVFALLPHYATDRFWYAAFQANLSMYMYFLSLYASLVALRCNRVRVWGWMLLGIVALLGSILAYEVVAPLFLLNALLVLLRGWQLRGFHASVRSWRLSILIAGLHALLLGAAVVFKLMTTDRAGALGGWEAYVWNVRRTIKGAVVTNYGDYGLALPHKVGRVLSDYPDAAATGIGIILGLLIFGYLSLVVGRAPARSYGRWQWASLAAAGVIAFGLGYAFSLATFDVGFSSTGINNRTAIAAAIGVAISFVAGIGWLSSLLPGPRIRHLTFCALISAVSVSGFLIINTIAQFWISASRVQDDVIEAIAELDIPRSSVLLLDGVCPYEGPGIVFETNWDVSGMLRLKVDPTLRGDVVKSNTVFAEDGVVVTQLYDDDNYTYLYGTNLLVYNARDRRLHRLTTPEAARRYVQVRDSMVESPCPPGREGHGVQIF